MFLRLQTQWRIGMAGRTGMDYAAAIGLFNLYEVEKPAQKMLMEDLQVMEAAVLEALAKREA